MRNCRKCQAVIPNRVIIEGKQRVLSSRKFCLDCSPWGGRNTKPDIDKKTVRPKGEPYKNWDDEVKKNHAKRTYEFQKRRRFERKKKFVLSKGGCCSKCGYDKSLRALTFHHREPEKKEFNLTARELGMMSEARLLNEVNKCDLLCANCHMEEHASDEMMNWK